ncbi:unnamed protein product [Durusdinium trenchii]|uniref:ADP-ribosylation factor-like protein 2-binding protein n=1 Tax=Durusdinium trenchii TaxID=1381693 RepID=A0ABP0NV81_9DINO
MVRVREKRETAMRISPDMMRRSWMKTFAEELAGYREAPKAPSEGDDFVDIVDSPDDGAELHAEMISGTGEDDDFTITGGPDDVEDFAFDRQVEALQEAVLDDSFQEVLNAFCREHCHHFEDTEENKLIYTDLFNQYSALIEGHLEKQMTSAIPGFSMGVFLEELAQRGEDEIDCAVLDLLISLSDFLSFKQQMLMVKEGDPGLSLSGTATMIHLDEDEEGEARPDLDGLLTVTPASPQGDWWAQTPWHPPQPSQKVAEAPEGCRDSCMDSGLADTYHFTVRTTKSSSLCKMVWPRPPHYPSLNFSGRA